jgi:hypothetical protein
MNNPDTKRMVERVEKQTGYCVSIDLISGIHEHAQMISARPESPVHIIRVNASQRSFADYIVAVQCGILLILWSDPEKVPSLAMDADACTRLAARWGALPPLSALDARDSEKISAFFVQGLVKQLQSMPLEISVARLVFEKCAGLRGLQAESFRSQLQNLSQVLTAKVKETAPSEVFQKNVAMNAALALGWSEIAGERIALLPYESTGHLEAGQELFAKLQAAQVGDSAAYTTVVDAWARTLSLECLYRWDFSNRHT